MRFHLTSISRFLSALFFNISCFLLSHMPPTNALLRTICRAIYHAVESSHLMKSSRTIGLTCLGFICIRISHANCPDRLKLRAFEVLNHPIPAASLPEIGHRWVRPADVAHVMEIIAQDYIQCLPGLFFLLVEIHKPVTAFNYLPLALYTFHL